MLGLQVAASALSIVKALPEVVVLARFPVEVMLAYPLPMKAAG